MRLFASVRTLMACAALVALAAIAGSADPDERDKPKLADPPKVLDPNRANWEMKDIPLTFCGVVTEVTNSSITLKEFKDGTEVRYTAHTALARAEVMDTATGRIGYRLQDVAVGDQVGIGAVRQNGLTYCLCLCVHKRPGGRLPPAFKDYDYRKYHETQNEFADLEEHGIPLSDKVIVNLSKDDPLRIKSEKIKAALKAKASPPERIEKLKD
jgi:hypothetical protein